MGEALLLRSEELSDLATPAGFVDADREVGEGAPAEPRTALVGTDPPGLLTCYIAVLPETGAMGGLHLRAGFGANDAFFATPLFDAQTGEPLAVLDGAWFTRPRRARSAPSAWTRSPWLTPCGSASSGRASRLAASSVRPRRCATGTRWPSSRRRGRRPRARDPDRVAPASRAIPGDVDYT